MHHKDMKLYSIWTFMIMMSSERISDSTRQSLLCVSPLSLKMFCERGLFLGGACLLYMFGISGCAEQSAEVMSFEFSERECASVVCQNDTAIYCLGTVNERRQDCAASGGVCFERFGCRACEPNTNFCNDAQGLKNCFLTRYTFSINIILL